MNHTLWTAEKNLLEGAALVIAVLLGLLGNWRHFHKNPFCRKKMLLALRKFCWAKNGLRFFCKNGKWISRILLKIKQDLG